MSSKRTITTDRPLDPQLRLKLQQLDEFLAFFFRGRGSPQNVVKAPVGAIYQRVDGGTNTTLYVKESGTGTAGWVAK